MHNLKRNFDKFYTIAKSFFTHVDPEGNFQYYRRKPKMSDIEIIALALSSEAIGIDSGNYLFGKLTVDYFRDFQNLPDRSNYNRRRRRLAGHIERLNRKIAASLSEGEDVFIVDSIPVPVCKIVRGKSSRICKEYFETAPDKGYSAVNKSYIFGYKLHLVTSLKGVYYSMDLTKASVHDINYLQDLKEQGLSDCTLIGDRGYLSAAVKTDLFHECQINLQVPMRKNQNRVGRGIAPPSSHTTLRTLVQGGFF